MQRQFIQTLLEGQQDKIISELNTLQGKDYLTAIHGFMEFAIPKLQRTEIEGESIKNIRVITGMVIM